MLVRRLVQLVRIDRAQIAILGRRLQYIEVGLAQIADDTIVALGKLEVEPVPGIDTVLLGRLVQKQEVIFQVGKILIGNCLLYTSDAADE